MSKDKLKTDGEVVKEITERVMEVLQEYPYEFSRKAIDILFLTAKTMDKREEKKTIQ